ncbi:MAG: ImmA/IrrE family metallo-endopeptidase [Acidobacteriota bacterium]
MISRKDDALRKIRHLLIGPPVDLRRVADELGLKLWESTALPKDVAGKLTRDPQKAGSSGFGVVVRKSDTPARKRFTIAHEIAHFLLHKHLSLDGEIVDREEPQAKEMYRSNLSNSMEGQANTLASNILMPWSLLAPLIDERKSALESRFQVSREALDIRLAGTTARRLKQGVKVSPVLAAHFKAIVETWHKDTRHTSSLTKMISHPSYKRIIEIGPKVLPLLLRELNERPDHWLVALATITNEDPAPDGSTFSQAVQAWLAWGRDRGYLR